MSALAPAQPIFATPSWCIMTPRLTTSSNELLHHVCGRGGERSGDLGVIREACDK